MENENKNYASCSACGGFSECNTQTHYPDKGWVLPYELFGYEGGFDDELPVLLGSRPSREWIMCHECVLKFLETFPRLAETIGKNLHPCSKDDETPCCRYAWKGTEIFGKNVTGVHTRTAYPDGVWHDEPESGLY